MPHSIVFAISCSPSLGALSQLGLAGHNAFQYSNQVLYLILLILPPWYSARLVINKNTGFQVILDHCTIVHIGYS